MLRGYRLGDIRWASTEYYVRSKADTFAAVDGKTTQHEREKNQTLTSHTSAHGRLHSRSLVRPRPGRLFFATGEKTLLSRAAVCAEVVYASLLLGFFSSPSLSSAPVYTFNRQRSPYTPWLLLSDDSPSLLFRDASAPMKEELSPPP